MGTILLIRQHFNWPGTTPNEDQHLIPSTSDEEEGPKIVGNNKQKRIKKNIWWRFLNIKNWKIWRSSKKVSAKKAKRGTKKFQPKTLEELLQNRSFSEFVPPKMKNTGNDCYAIVVMHSLFSCQPVVEFILQKYQAQKNGDPEDIDDLSRIVYKCMVNYFTDEMFEVTDLIKELNFNREQQDACEFLRKLMNNYFGQSMFEISTTGTSGCLHCDSGINQIDTNVILTLHIETARNTDVTIEKLLKQHFENEEQYEAACSSCNKDKATFRRVSTSLRTPMPPIICVAVSPFYVVKGGKASTLERVEKPIEIGDTFDFSKYVAGTTDEKYEYEAVSVVHHFGVSENSGHYAANVTKQGKHYACNDDIVKTANNRNDCGEGGLPYLIVYKLLTPDNPEALSE